MIITLTGDIASGKSTVAKILAEKLSMKRYSSGDFFRAMASEQWLDLLEFSHLSERDGGMIDREVDKRQAQLGQADDNFIIDGRLAFYFIPHSFRVRLTVDGQEAARRIFGDTTRWPSDSHASLQSAYESMFIRRESEKKRYFAYYNLDVGALTDEDFDVTIDTSKISPHKAADLIIKALKRSLEESEQSDPIEALMGLIARRRVMKYHNNELPEHILHQLTQELQKLTIALASKDRHQVFDEMTDTLWSALKLTDALAEKYGIGTNRLFSHAFHKYSERMPYLLSESDASLDDAQRIWDEIKLQQKSVRLGKPL